MASNRKTVPATTKTATTKTATTKAATTRAATNRNAPGKAPSSRAAAGDPRARERLDLVTMLDVHRGFLRMTARDLTDEQAARRTTVSALTVGGLIKHVTGTEHRWMLFAVGGAEAMEAEPVDWERQFVMGEGDTIAGLLAEYEKVARATSELVATLDLDQEHPLPVGPWFEPNASWSVRRTLLHILAETAQHAGHADIIREALDGAKTMG